MLFLVMFFYYLMCGIWIFLGVIFIVEFDDEVLILKFIKCIEIFYDEFILWMVFDV